MKDVVIKLRRRESDGGEVYDTLCDDLTSQVATSGKNNRLQPSTHHRLVHSICTSQRVDMLRSRGAGIHTTRSRKRSLHQTTMHATDS
jgi:hypothetical protein